MDAKKRVSSFIDQTVVALYAYIILNGNNENEYIL